MRYALGALAIAGLCLSVASCGGSSGDPASGSSSRGASAISAHSNDRDNDGDHNDDDEKVLGFGHAANDADRRASVVLVARYFAAAVREDGARACALLAPITAESVVEWYRHSPGLRGGTCAAVLSKVFKLLHRPLAEKSATLRVMAVRIEGDRALTVLDFPTIPEVRQITERRVGSTWKLLALFDGILE